MPLGMGHQQMPGRPNQFLLFSEVDRLGCAPEAAAGACSHFDDDQHAAIQTDQVKFTHPASVALFQDPQTLTLQIPAGAVFPGEAGLLRGRQAT